MYTVKNNPDHLLVIVESASKKVKKQSGSEKRIVKIYYDNLAIEVITDNNNGGY
jgi:hypothetical protein